MNPMSYENEEYILQFFEGVHEEENRAELIEVYRKAKAFDEIFKLYIGYEDGWIHFPRGSKSFNKEIINVCKSYESGDYDVKK